MSETTINIIRYTPEYKKVWDDFTASSKNGTFLFFRNYMDYHAHRIKDFSLMVYKGNRLTALLPASEHGKSIRSHGGLTYGGLIMGRDFSGEIAVETLKSIIEFYGSNGFSEILYRPVPHIYHRYPADEDIYALYRCNAAFDECNISSVIDLSRPITFNERNRRYVRKATAAGLTVTAEDDFAEYWALLENLLRKRYNTTPVHDLAEISRLRELYPDRIRLFGARDGSGELQAGVVLYYCGECVHCQYIASSEAGKSTGALPLIFSHILAKECGNARYFDFGTSNENHGLYLNTGLLAQKNGMGGRAIAYQGYRITIR